MYFNIFASILKKIIIAIDGFSGCGKSTTARGAAAQLHYKYIDSGAMYRAVTLYFIQNDIDYKVEKEVESALNNIDISFEINKENGNSEVLLNGKNVEKQIRSMDVSNLVSEVSAIKIVREKLVADQRSMGEEKGIVMDGRDIGTNVFPKAELKYFLRANTDVRVERRYKELLEKGQKAEKEDIMNNLLDRDEKDQSRKDNPLKRAEDAIIMDTSYLEIEEQIKTVVDKAKSLN